MPDFARPYLAAMASRFQLMLQYRAAAVAGFATQCWWGGIKVMIYAAFFHAAPAQAAAAPLSLSQTITYTWLTQAFLALVPWGGDPEVAAAVRTGAVTYDRLRPVDAYGLWFVRGAGWMTARAAPRALLMLAMAGVILPLLGLGDWAWKPPVSIVAGLLFVLSLGLGVLVSSAVTMLVNVIIVASLNDRGANTLTSSLVIIFSGNLLPLALYPDWMHDALLVQPLAGIIDIPFRIYFGTLSSSGILVGLGLQLFWTAALIVLGRTLLKCAMLRLEIQGG